MEKLREEQIQNLSQVLLEIDQTHLLADRFHRTNNQIKRMEFMSSQGDANRYLREKKNPSPIKTHGFGWKSN